jgi:hypothetical protein
VAWDARRRTKAQRLAAGSAHSDGKAVGTGDLQGLLHSVIRPGDRVALEGDNQKQADFLSCHHDESAAAQATALHISNPLHNILAVMTDDVIGRTTFATPSTADGHEQETRRDSR